MNTIKTLIFVIISLFFFSCSKEYKCDHMSDNAYNESVDLMMSGLEDQNKTKYNRGRNKMIDLNDCTHMLEINDPLPYEQALENYENYGTLQGDPWRQ